GDLEQAYEAGEPLPDELLARFLAARKFNQGFATVEFVSSALIDLEFHTQPAAASRDVGAFEKAELEKIGMPAEISLRHRPQQVGHIFSGDHYASGYYSYMWSEVMDADAFGAFAEAGTISDPEVAKRLHDNIYSSGGSRDPEEAYVAFRGREPEPDALLRRRGLLETSEAARHEHCHASLAGFAAACRILQPRRGRGAFSSPCLDHRNQRSDLCP